MLDPATQHNRRILIVDDNQDIHEDYRKTLTKCAQPTDEGLDADEALLFGEDASAANSSDLCDFDLDHAYQGQQAYEMVQASLHRGDPYAMAFVDMRMPPGWDGLETIEKIWEIDHQIQVVICSAYSDHSFENIVARLGRSDRLLIVKKPFDTTEIIQTAVALTHKWDLTRLANAERGRLEQAVEERTREIQYAAQHDRLTGLSNREHLQLTLDQSLTRPRGENEDVTLLFLDFDRFKLINDSLGHAVGDELLLKIALRLQTVLENHYPDAPERYTVSRLGGDEFVVLVDPIESAEEAEALGELVLQATREPYELNGYEVVSTPSIGITTGSISGHDREQLLRDADTAMYTAKSHGKDRYVRFDVSMHDRMRRRLELENNLRRVIERDELRVRYQPLVCAHTAKLLGTEALIRWEHPELGMVSPAEFIPIAEETGLIIHIGHWITQQAMAQTMRWRNTLPGASELYTSINLSKRQVLEPGLIETIRKSIDAAGLPAKAVHLEITETAVMGQSETVIPLLHELKGLGVKLSMDDFGTGQSSLTSLQEFPLDTVKIDRGFILNLDKDRAYSAIVQSVVTLAKNLGLKVVSEGIETQEQLAQIQTLECDAIQGYFFSKPLPAEEFDAWYLEHCNKFGLHQDIIDQDSDRTMAA